MASRRAALFETALVVLSVPVLFFFLQHQPNFDDWTRLADLQELLRNGHLRSGRYSLVMGLFAAPFSQIDDWVGSPYYLIARFNVVVVAVGLVVLWRLARGLVDAALLRRFILVLLFASIFTERMRGYGGEVFTAVCIGLGMFAVAKGRHRVLGWSAMVIGTVNTPGVILGLVAVAGAEAVRTRRLRSLWPVGAALVLIGAEAWIRRGSPFLTGYEGDHGASDPVLPYSGRPGFSYPFILGALAILFSFGRGLMFFTPGLLLWLGARTRRLVPGPRLVMLMLLFVAGLVVLYARWWAWFGGISWGPRFFLFAAVPASLFIATRLVHVGESTLLDGVTLGVLALSAWVGISGAITNYDAMAGMCATGDRFACWYVPEYSSLWQPVLHFPPLPTATWLFVAFATFVFGYLAAPLVASLARSARASTHDATLWVKGWQL